MSNSGINFKVYLVDGENSEVKRFFVDNDIVTSYVFMEEKIKCVFPCLRTVDFKINWKDTDGDLISISNDEDFITALTEMNYNPKVLHINTSSKNPPVAPPQPSVICDVCQNGITGFRYKCIECPDYDLCATCESNGNHIDHMMLRLPKASFQKVDRRVLNNAAKALKKSASQAHRCAKGLFKIPEMEKQSFVENTGTSTQTASSGCPFSATDVNQLISQNMSSLMEILSKPTTSQRSQNQEAPNNNISDLVHSFITALTGSVENDSNQPKEASSTTVNTDNQQNLGESNKSGQSQNSQFKSTVEPSAPTSIGNNQDMEWTMVGENNDAVPQSNAPSGIQTSQPPVPPQDPRLMRGLAQLHEMGFSNENNFLNYLLQAHDYDVANVVKAILQWK